MSIQLEIPTHIAQALRLPFEHQERQLLRELAVILYTRGILPFGKARQLANMEHSLLSAKNPRNLQYLSALSS